MLAAGRILGYTASDSSALVARSLFFADLAPPDGAVLAWPRGLVDSAARSRTALPVLELAGRASAATRQALPFAPWLEGRFRDARHRIEAADRPR